MFHINTQHGHLTCRRWLSYCRRRQSLRLLSRKITPVHLHYHYTCSPWSGGADDYFAIISRAHVNETTNSPSYFSYLHRIDIVFSWLYTKKSAQARSKLLLCWKGASFSCWAVRLQLFGVSPQHNMVHLNVIDEGMSLRLLSRNHPTTPIIPQNVHSTCSAWSAAD